ANEGEEDARFCDEANIIRCSKLVGCCPGNSPELRRSCESELAESGRAPPVTGTANWSPTEGLEAAAVEVVA
ncbi:hypothetical protein U1Q18_050089, partial [Sarracenia purpurea var. burkii]